MSYFIVRLVVDALALALTVFLLPVIQVYAWRYQWQIFSGLLWNLEIVPGATETSDYGFTFVGVDSDGNCPRRVPGSRNDLDSRGHLMVAVNHRKGEPHQKRLFISRGQYRMWGQSKLIFRLRSHQCRVLALLSIAAMVPL